LCEYHQIHFRLKSITENKNFFRSSNLDIGYKRYFFAQRNIFKARSARSYVVKAIRFIRAVFDTKEFTFFDEDGRQRNVHSSWEFWVTNCHEWKRKRLNPQIALLRITNRESPSCIVIHYSLMKMSFSFSKGNPRTWSMTIKFSNGKERNDALFLFDEIRRTIARV